MESTMVMDPIGNICEFRKIYPVKETFKIYKHRDLLVIAESWIKFFLDFKNSISVFAFLQIFVAIKSGVVRDSKK